MSPQHGGPHGKGPPPRGPLGAGALISLLLALLLAIVPPLYMWVLKPLRRMVAAAQRLGAGDLDTPIHTTRRDEFGELEQAFERMRQEVKRSMEQRDRLLTDVSHEIRGPLARMTLALPLMKKEGASGPVCDIFAQELEAVEHLVGEALALARGGYAPAHAHEPVDLGVLLAELIRTRQLWITEKDLQLSADYQPVCVSADRQLLARALGNVLDNALKYTDPGDTLHVATGTEGSEAWVRIQDSGPGIAPEHLPLVFEPFYRPDTSRSRETGGAGLGLSIVKRIVESHGGTVTLQCPPGEGTLVEMRLPLRSGPSEVCVER
jgi:two-component system sensor histidine kinase BaeS